MSLHEDRIGVLIGKKGSVKSLIEQICLVSISIDSETGRYEITIPDKVTLQKMKDGNQGDKPVEKHDLLNEKEESLDQEDEEPEDNNDDDFLSDDLDENSEEIDLKFGYDADSVKHIDISLDSPEVRSLQQNDDAYRIFVARRIIDAINYGFHPNKAIKVIHPNVHLEVIDLEDKIGTSVKKLTRYKGRLIGEKGKMRQSIEYYASVYMSIFRKYLALVGTPDKLTIAKKAISMILKGSPHKSVLTYLQTQYQKQKQEELKQNWKPIF